MTYGAVDVYIDSLDSELLRGGGSGQINPPTTDVLTAEQKSAPVPMNRGWVGSGAGHINIIMIIIIMFITVAVGITTGVWMDDGGIIVRIPVGSRIFTSRYRPDLLWGPTQALIEWVPRVLATEGKLPLLLTALLVSNT
jgi:hypothetical protein